MGAEQSVPTGPAAPGELRALHDVAMPPPTPWLPPQGPGWVLLFMLLLAVLARAGWRRLQRWRHDRYRREALARLECLRTQLGSASGLAELSALLKCTALHVFPRETVASLSGSAWRDFLCASGAPAFADASCAPLFDAAFSATCTPDAEQQAALFGAARQWLLGHPRADGRGRR